MSKYHEKCAMYDDDDGGEIALWIEETVRVSGLHGRARQELVRELESHVYEALEKEKDQGIACEDAYKKVLGSLGDARAVGTLFSQIHFSFMKKIFLGGGVLLLFFFVIFAKGLANYRTEKILKEFQDFRQETFFSQYDEDGYLYQSWYNEMMFTLVDGPYEGSCINDVDGLELDSLFFVVVDVKTCTATWRITPFSQPKQIAGPIVTSEQLLAFMKEHDAFTEDGQVRNVVNIFGEDDAEEQARNVLTSLMNDFAEIAGNSRVVQDDVSSLVNQEEKYELSEAKVLAAKEEMTASIFEQMATSILDVYKDDRFEQVVSVNTPADDLARVRMFCENNAWCFPLGEIKDISIERGTGTNAQVIMQVTLANVPEDIQNKVFTFTAIRNDAGVLQDWTDDVWEVTGGAWRE